MGSLYRSRGWAPLLGLGFLAACTEANPAYRRTASASDAASEEDPPVTGLADAAAMRADQAGPQVPDAADPSGEDAALTSDLALPPPPDLGFSLPDLAVSLPDLAPPSPDLARDLATDTNISTANLVGYWRCDEGSGSAVIDDTSTRNNGVTRNGATWQAGGFPNAKFANGASLKLDGVDDFVEITTNSGIPGNNAPKTLTAWFKATNPKGIPIRNLVALTNEMSDRGVQLGLDEGRVAAWFYGDLGPQIWADQEVDTNWHHAAYTFDGRTHRIYYDGRPGRFKDVSRPAGDITRTRIGTWSAPEEMFQGLIDDVRIYARKLEDAEIMALFNGQQ